MEKEVWSKIVAVKDFINKRFYIALPVVCLFFFFSCSFLYQVFTPLKPGFYFFPVGQGDSSMVVTEKGRRILIDGGPPAGNLIFWLDQIIPFYDRYIDVVVLTHPQLDHFGGFLKLLKNYRVGVFVENGLQGNTWSYLALREVLREKDIKNIYLKAGDEMVSGDDLFKIVYPFDFKVDYKNLNEKALVIDAITSKGRALFTSDIGKETEDKIIGYISKVDVLKVPHHGSLYSLNDAFFVKTSPLVAVIAVGKNSYGHPSKKVIDALLKLNALVLRTDEERSIIRIIRNKDEVMVSRIR